MKNFIDTLKLWMGVTLLAFALILSVALLLICIIPVSFVIVCALLYYWLTMPKIYSTFDDPFRTINENEKDK